ncbi:hypothetical protein Sste5346_005195, partial [Sporothrix stenoceras]
VLAVFLDGEFKEGTTDIVKIDAFDAGTVEQMTRFVYGYSVIPQYDTSKQQVSLSAANNTNTSTTTTQSSTPTVPNENETPSLRAKLLELVQLNGIGDYYGIIDLCRQTNDSLSLFFTYNWSAIDFFESASKASVSTGDNELHKMFAEFAARNANSLMVHRADPAFSKLVNLHDFAGEFMHHSNALAKSVAATSAPKGVSYTSILADMRETRLNLNYSYKSVSCQLRLGDLI